MAPGMTGAFLFFFIELFQLIEYIGIKNELHWNHDIPVKRLNLLTFVSTFL